MVPFTIQVTRGLLRDERSRRKTMGISLLIAVVMLVAGLTVLRPWLNPHEHPWRFIFFWFACAWETLLVLLLALLLVRSQACAVRRTLSRESFPRRRLQTCRTPRTKNESRRVRERSCAHAGKKSRGHRHKPAATIKNDARVTIDAGTSKGLR
jgi:hypothetical protein